VIRRNEHPDNPNKNTGISIRSLTEISEKFDFKILKI
jgi:hypothetical protein